MTEDKKIQKILKEHNSKFSNEYKDIEKEIKETFLNFFKVCNKLANIEDRAKNNLDENCDMLDLDYEFDLTEVYNKKWNDIGIFCYNFILEAKGNDYLNKFSKQKRIQE